MFLYFLCFIILNKTTTKNILSYILRVCVVRVRVGLRAYMQAWEKRVFLIRKITSLKCTVFWSELLKHFFPNVYGLRFRADAAFLLSFVYLKERPTYSALPSENGHLSLSVDVFIDNMGKLTKSILNAQTKILKGHFCSLLFNFHRENWIFTVFFFY